jgi:hypothetical protein
MRFAMAVLSASFFVACAPSLKRTGYSKAETREASCPVAFGRQGSPLDTDKSAVSLGIVEVKDGGFTMSCTEGDMLKLVWAEVCSQGGNAAMILDEKQPDLWSSCYRVKAEILHVNPDSVKAWQDARYEPVSVAKRSAANSASQTATLVGAIVGGLVAGFLVAR